MKRGTTRCDTRHTGWPRDTVRLGIRIGCAAGLAAAAWRLYTAPYGPCLYCPGALHIFAATLAAAYVCAWGLYLASAGDGVRTRVPNLLLASAALGVAVATLELPAGLGWLDYRNVIVPHQEAIFEIRPWMNPQNRRDRDLLHLHQPHSQFSGTSLGDLVGWYGIPTDHRYPVDVRYDRHGFRNAADLERAAVAVIGDSFVESPMVAQEQLLSSQLERHLGAGVANLGQAGYGPQQERIVLQRYALPLQPRVVLWLFYEGNDLEDFNRYARTREEWDQHERALDGFASRSFTRNILLGLASRMPRPRNELWRQRGCAYRGRNPGDSVPLYFAFGDSPRLRAESAFRDGATLAGVTEVIGSAARLAEASAARFILVYVPIKWRVYQPFSECAAETEVAHWRLADLPQYFDRWAREHGVPFLDLTPALRDAARSGELVFYSDDDHWNDRGQAVAARAIVAFLHHAAGPLGAGVQAP